MYLLLTAATAGEISPVADFLQKNRWRAGEWEVEILLTGVGAVATTYHLTTALLTKKPTIVLQAGIAGSFAAGNIGKTVAIAEDRFADLGVWEAGEFKDHFDLGLAAADTPPFSNRSVKNSWQSLLALAGAEAVRAITVNEISTDPYRINWYKKNLLPVVESMEGAAFHYVCLQQQLPFLQLRSISNEIGERDKSKWEMKKAITNLNEQLINLINSIAQHDETYFRI